MSTTTNTFTLNKYRGGKWIEEEVTTTLTREEIIEMYSIPHWMELNQYPSNIRETWTHQA